MRKGCDAEWKKMENIMTFIVATNVHPSRLPERRPTGMPHARAKTPEAVHAVPNNPGSLNMKRSFSKVFVWEDLKKKMS